MEGHRRLEDCHIHAKAFVTQVFINLHVQSAEHQSFNGSLTNSFRERTCPPGGAQVPTLNVRGQSHALTQVALTRTPALLPVLLRLHP